MPTINRSTRHSPQISEAQIASQQSPQLESFGSIFPRRFGAIRGSKRGDLTSVWGDSREVGGPLRYRFGVAFLTRIKFPVDHKHRPNQHLSSAPIITTLPNTILRTLRTPDSSNPAPLSPLLRDSAPPRENCRRLFLPRRFTVVSGSKTVGSMSVQSRLRDASGSVLCRFGVGFLNPKTNVDDHNRLLSKHLSISNQISTAPNTIFARISKLLTANFRPPTPAPPTTFIVRPPHSTMPHYPACAPRPIPQPEP